jgi:hypothetical protein
MEGSIQPRASASTTFSQFSTMNSVNEYIDLKIECISAKLVVNSKFKDCLENDRSRHVLDNKDYYIILLRKIESDNDRDEEELITLKRQKKAIVEDIDEVLPQYYRIEDAYAPLMRKKIMFASRKRQGKKFTQRAFAKEVLSFYNATRISDIQQPEKYCHLTGWQPEQSVKCVHIVPKSLESDELNYLFGVEECILSEAQNGSLIFIPFVE